MAILTLATQKILKLTKKIRAISGGTGASKTYSIIMILIDFAQSNKNQKIDVVSASFPHLEDGAIHDFKEIMQERNYWNDTLWNESKHFYNFETGSVIKFISFDKLGKAHGPRRDVLFLNEGNYLPWTIVDQLITRTRKTVFIDWNPSEEFWFQTEMIGKRTDIDFMGDKGSCPPLTYLDNEALTKDEISEIESHKNNKNWWRVYGLGLLGDIEGRIYRDWQIIDDIPHEARLQRYGVDFGYSNDPTAIVAIYYYNGSYIFDEITYRKGLSNKLIADILNNNKQALVIADSAEPKSIDEIASYGVSILPANKGQGSVNQGIAYIQSQKISITIRSVNGIKEYRNYLWITDKDGKIINEPSPFNNHFLDASRYGMNNLNGDLNSRISTIQNRQFQNNQWEFLNNNNK